MLVTKELETVRALASKSCWLDCTEKHPGTIINGKQYLIYYFNEARGIYPPFFIGIEIDDDFIMQPRDCYAARDLIEKVSTKDYSSTSIDGTHNLHIYNTTLRSCSKQLILGHTESEIYKDFNIDNELAQKQMLDALTLLVNF